MKVVFCIMKKRKSFLITGATSGVGYALTKRLVKAGHEVWATGRAPDVLWELQNEGAHSIPADLSEEAGIDFVMNQIDAPDIVVFSAGVGSFQYAHDVSNETIQ